MKVLIVAKTRRGLGACVGAISADGQSLRLIDSDSPVNQRAGLKYEVGDVWEIEAVPDLNITPPHVENVIVLRSKRLRSSPKIIEAICRFMTPDAGGPERLFGGLLQATSTGGLCIAEMSGVPDHSTAFWIPDCPLRLDCTGKRLHYRYPGQDGPRTLVFVGFQEPVEEIPAGTLVRVSLAHWWRRPDKPEEELRCFAQLSGWFMEDNSDVTRHLLLPAVTRSSAHPAATAAGAAHKPHTLDTLKQRFGFSEFLPLQDKIISRLLRKEDTLAVMPTGGGKSLCYQLPALLFDGLTVVVSPLVALMQDQISHLTGVGVPAACLNHLVAFQEYERKMREAREGRLKLLYLAPETLVRPEILLLLEHSRTACIAIDEAHCISEWGHDFRPEYRKFAQLRTRFPNAVCAALTATATERVRKDIRQQLNIPPEGEFVASFDRKNLLFAVEERHDRLAQVLEFLESRRGQSGIIYCGTRKQADELSEGLAENGWPALAYHAGMEGAARRRNQERFTSDQVQLMVATVAFGMGINKSNIRFVIHAHMPKDLESYYQEVGRAGRDGIPADCLLLYGSGDAIVHRHFIRQGAASEQQGREARLQAMLGFAETRACRRRVLLNYFGEAHEKDCGNCDNCVPPAPDARMIDRTDYGRTFLSCVQATRQLYGAAHIAAILRGSRSEKVRSKGHHKLSQFGAGPQLSARDWQILAGQMVQLGFLDRSPDFGGLRLTSKGWDAISGKTAIKLRV